MAVKKVSKKSTRLGKVGVRELRQEASVILRRVKAGEQIEITEHGEPVALLQPIVRSHYESMISAGLITPARNPERILSGPLVKLKSGPSASEVLAQLRAEERY